MQVEAIILASMIATPILIFVVIEIEKEKQLYAMFRNNRWVRKLLG